MLNARDLGLWAPERADDVPFYCDEIGCGCVVRKQLRVFRSSATARLFVCPSSRVCATYDTKLSPVLVMGQGYKGDDL